MIQAFHNKDSLKQKVIFRMEQHIKADQLVQGTGYDKSTGKGCAVGCSIDCYDHQSFADTLGLDIWIPQMYDTVHEGISAKHFKKFDMDFIKSIPVGMTTKQSDLVRLQLFYFMLTEIIPSEFQKYKEIADIIELFKLSIEGVTVTKSQWRKVADAIPSEYKYPASVSVSAYASASAYTYASVSAYTYAYTYTYVSVSAYAYTYTYVSASASAYTSASKLETMLKIGNKLIELFKEVKERPAK